MPKSNRGLVSPFLRKAFFGVGLFLPFLAATLIVGFSGGSFAQSSGTSPDMLNQLRQQLGQQGVGSSGTTDLTGSGQGYQNTIIQSAPVLNAPPLPPSRLEQIISARAGARLEQFGYDQLGRGRAVSMSQTGAVQDDYVLGPGDQIVISLRGQENSELRAEVNRNGQVVLPRLNPIAAIGRSFGSFRRDLEAAVHRAYVATDASVSVSRVRQISVLVSGEVNVPGERLLTGLSSAVDAILVSGGVKKTGSLRSVRIQRGGHEFTVDLYSVLTGGGVASNLRLADGDRIIVPILGRTVAVTGLVRQPGIFELPAGQSSMPVRALLSLAGGQEVGGRYRLSVLRFDAQGNSNLSALTGETGLVRDSEILFVQLGADQTTSRATLSGNTGLAGAYPVLPGTKLSDVLRAPGALGTAPYTLFGVIARKDPRTLLRTLIPFTPVAVLNGGEDLALQAEDVVRPISVKEARLADSTIRVYVQRRNEAEQALRDPLSDINNSPQTQTAPTTTIVNGQTVQSAPQNINTALAVSSGRSASGAALDREADIQLIGNLTQRQLDMVASNQAKLTDFRFIPEQNTDLGTEGMYLPTQQSQNPQAIPSPQAIGTLPAQNDSRNQYGQGQPVTPRMPTMYDQNVQPTQNTYYPADASTSRPPAANFQEQPTAPGMFPTNREAPTFNALAQQLGVDPLVLINFVIDNQVTLDGAVRGPGSYFVGPNASLQDLVQAAGGTVNWADASGVELTSTAVDGRNGRSLTQRTQLPLHQGLFASYIVKPHDVFRFNQVYADSDIGSVTIQGEVRFTGTYRIKRGDRLSDLLVRAGGLTNTAYPYGTVFLRKSAAEAERDSYIRGAREIEDQLVVAMTRVGTDKISPDTFSSMQSFVSDLRNQKAVGRISVQADPSVLAAKPALDPLLEGGDVIYVPQRSSTVAVLGQVMQPGSYPYRAGESFEDYIEQAGGYSDLANNSSTYIVLPDGSARKIDKSWLSFDTNALPPGSSIVVPRDVTPLDLRQTIIDVSQILSQLAISIASVAVISRN